jgi:hypothetical protein
MPYECFYTLPKRIEDRRAIWQIEKRLRSRTTMVAPHVDRIPKAIRSFQSSSRKSITN